MVENFGSYLKHERELRGVPLEEISGATKIHIRFLQALEDNRFDDLPGEVFIKGYIRSYADTIGSDVEEVLNIYEESVGVKSQKNDTPSESQPNVSAKKFLGMALGGLLLIALGFGIKFLILDENNTKPEKVSKPSMQPSSAVKKEIAPKIEEEPIKEVIVEKTVLPTETTVKEEKEEAAVSEEEKKTESVEPETEIQKQEASSTPKEEAGSEGIENPKPLKLTIKVENDSWFNLTIDDFREEDFILQAGEVKSYWGNEVFRLTIGNKNGTEIILNEKSLVLPEGKENVIKDFIINTKLIE